MISQTAMRILDYKTGKELNDTGLFVTQEEAEELIATLKRLVARPSMTRIHLSHVSGGFIDRELTVSLEPAPVADVSAA